MNDNLVKDKKSAFMQCIKADFLFYDMHMYPEVPSLEPLGRNFRCMEKFETD